MLQNITNIDKTTTSNTQYISKPSEASDVIENYLFNIFEKELNEKNSVLLSYKPIAIKKISAYITGRINMPASIGISGETASGKSTITKDLIETIKSFGTEFGIPNIIKRVNTDDYYYDRSDIVKKAGSFS
ncbi:MAG: hypothetical protein MJ230_06325 [bacterium]|nr:hypothetical protein [bacterium]